MAHIGVFGPIAFRRDLNLNVENNIAGWYRGYKFGFGLLPLGEAHILSGKRLDATPDFMSAINIQSWKSVPKQIGIHFWDVQLDVTIQPKGASYSVDWTLSDTGVATVWKINWLDENAEQIRPGRFIIARTTYWNPLYWDQQPNATQVFVSAMLWADY